MYCSSLFLKKGQQAWPRIYAGHEINKESFLTDGFLQLFTDRNMSFMLDLVQAPSVITCGWLLGTLMRHPLT